MPIHRTTLIGAAGEHYVIFRLLGMGYIAGLAPQGAPNTDIIVTNIGGGKSVAIQVKTKLFVGRDQGWHMRPKHAEISEPYLFYCFVDLSTGPESLPPVYILPSSIVAKAIDSTHKLWLSLPGVGGRPHKDSNVRRLLPDYSQTLHVDHPVVSEYSEGWLDEYKENWKILGL